MHRNILIAPDIKLSGARLARLEEPVTDEAFAFLEAHDRLDNLKTFMENWTEIERETAAKCSGAGQFVAVKGSVMYGRQSIATAVSHTMAKRIARALNAHKTNSRGV